MWEHNPNLHYTNHLHDKKNDIHYYIYDKDAIHNGDLKTINGQNIVGDGDISILTNSAFPASWPVDNNSTIGDLVRAINRDDSAVVGMSYLGHVDWSHLYTDVGIFSGEILVEVMYQYWEGNKVIHFVLTSGDRSPYRWERTIWNDGSSDSGWISFLPSASLTAALNRVSTLETQVTSLQNALSTLENKILGYHTLTGIELNRSELTVEAGGVFRIIPRPIPATASFDSVIWTVGDSAILSVDHGLFTALAAGTTTVTATASKTDDGTTSTFTANATITVTAASEPSNPDEPTPVTPPEPSEGQVIDSLDNASTIKSNATAYSEWTASNSTASESILSSAVYKGQSAGGSGTIQMRSNNNNSGIVTTSSGGILKSISINWFVDPSNANTNLGRIISIYGSHSAFNSPTDLYANNNLVAIGEISFDSANPLQVYTFENNSDYEYFGIRSKSGAVYISDIFVTWVGTPAGNQEPSEEPEPQDEDLPDNAAFDEENNVLVDDDDDFLTLED